MRSTQMSRGGQVFVSAEARILFADPRNRQRALDSCLTAVDLVLHPARNKEVAEELLTVRDKILMRVAYRRYKNK